jgi:hypothetical protein
VTTVVTSVAVWFVPVYVAVIVVDADVAAVVIENDSVLEPSGIVTLAGTATAALLLANVTAAPPAGAAAVSVTVAVTGVPPTTELDDNTMDARAAVVGAVVVGSLAQAAAPRHVRRAAIAVPHKDLAWIVLVTTSIVQLKRGKGVSQP